MKQLDENAALRTILEGTATETGERFFYALVENLARALGTHGAWVTEYLPEKNRLRALAFLMDGEWIENYEFELAGTPCERVIESRELVHFPDRLLDLYPHDPDIADVGAVSYLGMPLLDVDGEVLGHMAVIDRRPMPDEPQVLTIFRIFAARAAAELQRLRREAEVRERERKLGRLLDSAMDAIIELDRRMCVTRMNPAAEQVFHCTRGHIVGKDFRQFLAEEGASKLQRLIDELADRPEGRRSEWIAGGLTARPAFGSVFPAEATLSQSESHHEPFYTLILRNVNDRLQAEERIRTLTVEAEYLKEELKALHDSDEIIGRSEPLLRTLRDVEQVAPTDATVLILGETGTGKELIARAIHANSPRRDHPFVKVNCAAIPSTLVESEFFGHEKGAFTGATSRREGRFALADGGTIFLDEVGELPLELQAKLLRVLQDGEFEPLGSAQTGKVNVRVLAATNRDLQQAVRSGEFREDLYYRLNVFPLTLPALRDRGDDIVLLARACLDRFARKMGRRIRPFSEDDVRRLKSYNWPGNVRELENVIERALITSTDGQISLQRALPETPIAADHDPPQPAAQVRTVQELEQLERDNITLALESCGWKVSGKDGAASLLGMKPSTLASRMKALGIKRPR